MKQFENEIVTGSAMNYRKIQTFNSQHQRNISIQKSSPITKYNIFINCYNMSQYNRIDEKTLYFMPSSRLFESFYWCFLSSKRAEIFLFSLFFLPLINIILVVYMLFMTSFYFKCLRIFYKNKKKVADPFQNMKYDPQKCLKLNKNRHFLQLNFKNSSQLDIKQNIELSRSQNKIGERVQYMIYNDEFKQYYTGVISYKKRFLIIVIASLMQILMANAILVLFITP